MREWSASELDSYNKREQQGNKTRGSKKPIKTEINVPRTASMSTQAAMRLKDRQGRAEKGIRSPGGVIVRPRLHFHCYSPARGQTQGHALSQIRSVGMYVRQTVVRDRHS
jgi:hypothetical protein